jgi:hypothetical protein
VDDTVRARDGINDASVSEAVGQQERRRRSLGREKDLGIDFGKAAVSEKSLDTGDVREVCGVDGAVGDVVAEDLGYEGGESGGQGAADRCDEGAKGVVLKESVSF